MIGEDVLNDGFIDRQSTLQTKDLHAITAKSAALKIGCHSEPEAGAARPHHPCRHACQPGHANALDPIKFFL
jgi:hypothetical protein